jgi:hypothetical protein
MKTSGGSRSTVRVGATAIVFASLASYPATARDANAGIPAMPPTVGACVGHWAGTGRNSGGPPWSIDMNVTATNGPVCGTIEYPSLGCGGTLINCTTRSGQTTFVEDYSHNAGRCAPDGTIVARCARGRMQWTWVGDDVVRTSLQRR